MSIGKVWIQPNGRLNCRTRRVQFPEGPPDVRQIEVRDGIRRQKLRGPLSPLKCRFILFEPVERGRQVERRVAVLRIVLESPPVMRNRVRVLTRISERQSQFTMNASVVRFELRRIPQNRDRQRQSGGLPRHDAQDMERSGTSRVSSQHGAAEFLGGIKIPALDILNCGRKRCLDIKHFKVRTAIVVKNPPIFSAR